MEKTKEIIDYLKFSNKLRVLRYAKDCGKNKDACEVFGAFYSNPLSPPDTISDCFISFETVVLQRFLCFMTFQQIACCFIKSFSSGSGQSENVSVVRPFGKINFCDFL